MSSNAESRVERRARDRKTFDKSSAIISSLPSLSLSVSLYLSTFRTGWKMFANKVFGGQWWKVTTRQRHKSEVVIGKEKRKRMQRMFAPPLFTILLFTRASASLRGIFTREYLERERNSSFLSVSFRSRTRRKF